MLVKSNAEKEKRKVKDIVRDNPELEKQHLLFQAEMTFKQELIEARKKKTLTQKEVSELSGLSQQAVSRLEKGKGGTLETILKYLSSMGYTLEIKES